MTYGSPQFPPSGYQPSSRNRGLLITIVVLLVAVVALAIGLIIALSGDAETPASEELTVLETQAASEQETPGPLPESTATEDSTPTEKESPEAFVPAESIEDPDVMAAQIHRDPDDPYALGDPDADVVIVEYADYLCTFCARWHVEVFPSLEPLIESGEVRFEYRDFPVLGDASIISAAAARAAGNQGKFWEYSDALYQDTHEGSVARYDLRYFENLAGEVGIEDIAQFSADLQSNEILTAVLTARHDVANLSLTGTPAFIVGDQFVPGFLDADQFMAIVNAQLP